MRSVRAIGIGVMAFAVIWIVLVVAFLDHRASLETAHVAWTYPLPESTDQVPDILSDGTIVCTGNGYINWLSPAGELLARRDIAGSQRSAFPGGVFNSMLLNFCYSSGARDLCFYCIGSPQGTPAVLHAVDKTGEDVWTHSFPESSAVSWVIFNDTHVFALLDNGGMAKLDLKGNRIWFQGPGTDPPEVVLSGPGDTLYTVSGNSELACRGADGTPLWRCQLQTTGGVNAADVAPDGTVYLVDWYASAEAVDPAGRSRWRRSLAGSGRGSLLSNLRMLLPLGGSSVYGGWMQEDPHPAARPGGGVAASAGERVVCLSDTGAVEWERTGGGVAGTPAVAPDGRVYVAFADGGLRAYSPGGRLLWRNTGINTFESDPIVGWEGKVLIEGDGKLWCFEP
jgi:outer membrane protein assembly factor BamB